MQGFAGLASLVVIMKSTLETRRMREVAVDQMAFLREQHKIAAAEKLAAAEPLVGLGEVQIVGRRASVPIVNFGAKIFDVVLIAEEPLRTVAREIALDTGEGFGQRHLMPARKERRRAHYTMTYRTAVGAKRKHRFAVGWEDGQPTLWIFDESALTAADERRLPP